MNSETFQAYKHSGKFGVHGPILALVIAALLGWPLGIAYVYLVHWIPFIYINFFATFGYGALFGLVTTLLLKYAKVRNTPLAWLTSLLVGFIAVYFAWSGYVFMMTEGELKIATPTHIVNLMKLIYPIGTWTLRGGTQVSGPVLAIVWLCEAGLMIAMAAFVGASLINKTPFCEDTQSWLDKTKDIDTLETFSDPTQRDAFKSGDLAPLSKAKPKVPGAPTFTRLTLKYSPKCDIFYTVRVQDVTLTRDKNGNLKTNVTPITKDLILPPAMFELIKRFENFTPAEPLATPPPASPPPGTV